MAIFTHYVTQIVADVSAFFEHSDVQTTTIALAISCSLFITVLWFVVNIVKGIQNEDGPVDGTGDKDIDSSKKISVVSSFHMNRKALNVSVFMNINSICHYASELRVIYSI